MKVQGTGASGPNRKKLLTPAQIKKQKAKAYSTTKAKKRGPKLKAGYTGPSPYNSPKAAGPSVSDLVNALGATDNSDWAKGKRVMDIESQPDSLDMAIKKIQRKMR